MNAFTPEWAMTAYRRLQDAHRFVSDEERQDAMRDSERRQKRATMLRRLERPA